jgi:hypothetical protein
MEIVVVWRTQSRVGVYTDDDDNYNNNNNNNNFKLGEVW